MKDTPISLCEKNFVLEALAENKRIDGRSLTERRELDIRFGGDWGCVIASLGDTRVMAQASCSITEPRATRPNEGILVINVDLNSTSNTSAIDETVEINRLLERCLKESRSLDMESLCIVSEEKVWSIRLDLHALNNEGNLADCASVAGLAALCHFRRPDVSLQGDQVTVHPIHERDPVPLSVHHHPVCSTFAFFGDSNVTVTDPSRLEEAIMDGKIIFGVNPYREICTLHLAGQRLLDKRVVLKLASQAATHAKDIVDRIKNALKLDDEERKSGNKITLAKSLQKMSILAHNVEKHKELKLNKLTGKTGVIPPTEETEEELPVEITQTEDGVIEMIPEKEKGENGDEEEEEEEEVVTIKGSDVN